MRHSRVQRESERMWSTVQIVARVPGAARLHLADGIPLLCPEGQMFTAMLEGWRHQHLAGNLALATITARERAAHAFAVHADAFPWLWTARLARRVARDCARSGDYAATQKLA